MLGISVSRMNINIDEDDESTPAIIPKREIAVSQISNNLLLRRKGVSYAYEDPNFYIKSLRHELNPRSLPVVRSSIALSALDEKTSEFHRNYEKSRLFKESLFKESFLLDQNELKSNSDETLPDDENTEQIPEKIDLLNLKFQTDNENCKENGNNIRFNESDKANPSSDTTPMPSPTDVPNKVSFPSNEMSPRDYLLFIFPMKKLFFQFLKSLCVILIYLLLTSKILQWIELYFGGVDANSFNSSGIPTREEIIKNIIDLAMSCSEFCQNASSARKLADNVTQLLQNWEKLIIENKYLTTSLNALTEKWTYANSFYVMWTAVTTIGKQSFSLVSKF